MAGNNNEIEKRLWEAADQLRANSSLTAQEYSRPVLGLIFLEYISDTLQAKYEQQKTIEYANPEDRDEYSAENIFWMSIQAKWANIQNNAKQLTSLGRLL